MPGALFWSQFEHPRNMTLVQSVLRHGPEAYDELFSEDLVNHPPLPTPGPEGMREVAARYAEAFNDMQVYIDYQVPAGEDGDMVVTAWRIEGILSPDGLETPLGTIRGTDERVVLRMLTIVRIEDGKIVERWGQI